MNALGLSLTPIAQARARSWRASFLPIVRANRLREW